MSESKKVNVAKLENIKSSFYPGLIISIIGVILAFSEMRYYRSDWFLWFAIVVLGFGLITAGAALDNYRLGYRKVGAGLFYVFVGAGLRITYPDWFAWLMLFVLIGYGGFLIWSGYQQMEDTGSFAYQDNRPVKIPAQEIALLVVIVLALSMIAANLMLNIL